MKHFLVVFLLLLNLRIHAADTLTVVMESDNYIFGNYCEMLEDKDDRYNIATIQKAEGWQSLKKVKTLNIPKINTTFWIRFSIRNEDPRNLTWMLEFPDGHNSFLQLYQISSEGKIRTYPAVGMSQPVTLRPFDHKNFLFDLSIPKGHTYTYYVKVKSRYYSSFWASLRSSHYLFSYITHEYYFLGIFYGIIFIMAMYNLLIYIFTRERVYLIYVFYVVSCGLYTFSEDLTGFQIFWPDIVIFNHLLFENAPNLLNLTFTFYAIEFLELRSSYPKTTYWLYTLAVLNILLSLSFSYTFPIQIKAILFILPFAIIYYLALKLFFQKKYKPARFFIIGYSIILGGFLVFVLRTYGIVPSNLYTIYIFNFGFVFEVLMFSYALGDKIRIIKNEKEKNQQAIIGILEEKEILKDKINKELEQKVTERTEKLKQQSEQLETANIKLKQLTEELNQMNSQLDLDNWNLKKQVKSETRSRILIEKVSYEEFLSIFPNDTFCLQYLENLKWEDGYTCKKCGYNSYSKGEKPFSRKCNKCKYSESATAGTLFHSIKFPLNKAFYITYDTFKETNIYTLDELSEIIDLRKATVWAFRKKVQEMKAEKLKKRKSLDSWEDIILE
ncbi:MAG TPA: 7TM diverse intracellular signaling domain-containing protein [Cytophagaceae bacterium]|nr:7TM diverse intracellular signaling domain-containing protein [Cytophagaceae bacterium]